MVTERRKNPAVRAGSLRHRAGHVLWFPAGATWLNANKPRPFAFAASRGEAAPATLVYGSTQRAEQAAGAATAQVSPVREGLNRNGLYENTFFYPGILLVIGTGVLPLSSGFLGKALPRLREALRAALGIGQGSCLNPAAPRGSRRGRIVVLTPESARQLRSSTAIILTEPAYSRAKRYQIIVPVVAGSRRPDRYDVMVTGAQWFAPLRLPAEGVLIPVSVALSVWHGQGIAHETEHVVDEPTLAEIDARLCDYFSLPSGEVGG